MYYNSTRSLSRCWWCGKNATYYLYLWYLHLRAVRSTLWDLPVHDFWLPLFPLHTKSFFEEKAEPTKAAHASMLLLLPRVIEFTEVCSSMSLTSYVSRQCDKFKVRKVLQYFGFGRQGTRERNPCARAWIVTKKIRCAWTWLDMKTRRSLSTPNVEKV